MARVEVRRTMERMGVYSDTNIRKALADGWLFDSEIPDENIQPASVDLTLADGYLPLRQVKQDARSPDMYMLRDKAFLGRGRSADEINRILCEPRHKGPYRLDPGRTVLVSTFEIVRIPDFLRGVVYNKSSLARVGLSVCSDAGYLDPGFRGQITLDLHNHGGVPILIEPGVKICQVEFCTLETPSGKPYGAEGRNSSYQDQRGATAARNSAA